MRLDPSAFGVIDDLTEVVHRDIARGGDPTTADGIAAVTRRHYPLAGAATIGAVVERVLHRVDGLGALEPMLADPDVTEVMVNGPGPIYVERGGRIERTDTVIDVGAIELAVERILAPLGLRADRTSPLVDARLPDGSRVNVVVPPLAIDGPCLTIRRFGARAVRLDELCPPGVAALLAWAVRDARLNLVAVGGTGAGKTTLLNALAGAIPPGERVVTIEDAAELRLPGEHVVRLEARPPNPDGAGGIAMRSLVRNALRMRPDRIVIGEVRGAEALDMLQAMNTGHEGSLSTCHANSPADALRRLETMVLLGDVGLPIAAVREQLVAALDLVVHVARLSDGRRRVVAIAEVADLAGAVERVRLLGDGAGLLALPSRRARHPSAPAPSLEWLS